MAGRGGGWEGDWRVGVGKFLVHDFFPHLQVVRYFYWWAINCTIMFLKSQPIMHSQLQGRKSFVF